MKLFCAVIFFLIVYPAAAQDSILNKYGLRIITTEKEYVRSATQNPDLSMVDLKKAVHNIVLDLRYSSTNNFTGKKIYPFTNTTYLRKKAATALAVIQRQLKKQGLGLKIFDAYRPYSTTELIWTLVKDKRYASSPKKGSNHNRGAAVDITIIDLQTQEELNMGTGFDNFSDTAHHNFTALPGSVLKNRLLLKTIMEENGFASSETEWWHYALPDAKEYDILDLGFKQLAKYQGKSKTH